MSEKVRLKRCPFCGGNAHRVDFPATDDGDANAGGSVIECSQCLASGPVCFDRKELLISSWNERIDGLREADDMIDLIIRDVAEIERDPLLDQAPDEMRVTADKLRAILESRFEAEDRAEREQMDHEQYQSTVSA